MEILFAGYDKYSVNRIFLHDAKKNKKKAKELFKSSDIYDMKTLKRI